MHNKTLRVLTVDAFTSLQASYKIFDCFPIKYIILNNYIFYTGFLLSKTNNAISA